MNAAAIAAYRAARQNIRYTKLHWNVANVVGIESALFIEIIQDWCDNNMVHQRKQYFHDDHWWTRGTYQEWEAKYPSLGSARTLQRLLLKLESDEYVLTAQFNKGKDNTKFYRVNEEKIGELYLQGLEEFRKSNVPIWHDETEVSNPPCQNGTTQDAKLARSSIYKQINKRDQDNPPIIPHDETMTPAKKEGGEISIVPIELIKQEVASPVATLTKIPSAQQSSEIVTGTIIPAVDNHSHSKLKKPNGSDQFPWEQIDPVKGWVVEKGFFDYVAIAVKDYSQFKGLPYKRFLREVLNFINKAHFDGERKCKLFGYWQDYQDELTQPVVAVELTVSQVVGKVQQQAELQRIHTASKKKFTL